MSSIIGRRYLGALAQITAAYRDFRSSGFQEGIRFVPTNGEHSTRCYYNGCGFGKKGADTIVLLEREHPENSIPIETTIIGFHGSCLDKLISDERIPSVN